MPKFCRQYEYRLKNSSRDFPVCLTANFCIQANCVWFCASVRACVCVCVFVCVRACVRASVRACVRERGMRTLITLWNRIEYVTRSHEMSLNLKFGNWRYLHVSNLQVPLVILIFTAVARKISWSFCQKCRWQVTAKHAYALRMWLCMRWYGAWLCGVHRTRLDCSSFMWHQPCQRCSTPLRWIFKNAL